MPSFVFLEIVPVVQHLVKTTKQTVLYFILGNFKLGKYICEVVLPFLAEFEGMVSCVKLISIQILVNVRKSGVVRSLS